MKLVIQYSIFAVYFNTMVVGFAANNSRRVINDVLFRLPVAWQLDSSVAYLFLFHRTKFLAAGMAG
jgi:hypothetical protein